jgi:hypothetical protein
MKLSHKELHTNIDLNYFKIKVIINPYQEDNVDINKVYTTKFKHNNNLYFIKGTALSLNLKDYSTELINFIKKLLDIHEYLTAKITSQLTLHIAKPLDIDFKVNDTYLYIEILFENVG